MIEALKKSGKVIVDDAHEWGYQLRFVNTPLYAGKFLVLQGRDTWGSFHYHKEKTETFIVLQGAVYLDVRKRKDARSTVYNGILIQGEQVTINPYERHKMQNSFDEDTIILEVSTHDDDDDCYRI